MLLPIMSTAPINLYDVSMTMVRSIMNLIYICTDKPLHRDRKFWGEGEPHKPEHRAEERREEKKNTEKKREETRRRREEEKNTNLTPQVSFQQSLSYSHHTSCRASLSWGS